MSVLLLWFCLHFFATELCLWLQAVLLFLGHCFFSPYETIPLAGILDIAKNFVDCLQIPHIIYVSVIAKHTCDAEKINCLPFSLVVNTMKSNAVFMSSDGWHIVRGRFCHSLTRSTVIQCVSAGKAGGLRLISQAFHRQNAIFLTDFGQISLYWKY